MNKNDYKHIVLPEYLGYEGKCYLAHLKLSKINKLFKKLR